MFGWKYGGGGEAAEERENDDEGNRLHCAYGGRQVNEDCSGMIENEEQKRKVRVTLDFYLSYSKRR